MLAQAGNFPAFTYNLAVVKRLEIEKVVQWCGGHNLMLNVKRTKEMVFDPRSVGDHSPVLINRKRDGQVTTYKYLGIHFDAQLQWAHQVEYVCSRTSQRHFLRMLRVHGVVQSMTSLFYRAAI